MRLSPRQLRPLARGPQDSVYRAQPAREERCRAAIRTTAQCARDRAGVAERSGLADWEFAYQSQGMTGRPWLGPTVESLPGSLTRRQGVRELVIDPIGFVCDHVEILYDVDIAFREYAASARHLRCCGPNRLNDSPRSSRRWPTSRRDASRSHRRRRHFGTLDGVLSLAKPGSACTLIESRARGSAA